MPLISAAAILGLLAPRPGRLEFAARLALISALTVLVTEIYQTPEPALTAYVVFFLNRGDRATSVITSIGITVAVSVLIVFVFGVANLVADDAMWRVICIALVSFCLLFLASASKLRPVAGTFALIVGYALDVLGAIKLGEDGTRGLLYAWLFVGIPAGVSIIVNLLLAPAPRRLAEQGIALRLRLCAAMLRAPDDDLRRRFRECLREGAAPMLGHIKLAGVEYSAGVQDRAALRQAAYSSVALLSAINLLDSHPDDALPAALREQIASTCEQMADVLTAGGYPLEVSMAALGADSSLSPLAARAFAGIEAAILSFAEPPHDEAAPPPEAGGFLQQDAFTNPDHVRYALKTTAAAVFCYVLYSLLDWPGIHTCFLTCYIVSLGTTAESIEKLSLRLAGCVTGAAAGIAAIVYLVPSLTSIGGLMAVVFVGALAAAYVAAGSARIGYAGFQMAFAFFLCVVQGAGPAFDLSVARDRVIGILLGNVVVYVLFTHLWPVTVSRRIDPTMATLLKRLGALVRATTSRERRVLASAVQTTLASLETDVDLALYEPPAMRPDSRWLRTRRDAAHEMSTLDELLLLDPAGEESFRAAVAHRLDDLAERMQAPQEAPSPPPKPGALSAGDGQPLHAIVERHVRRLEAALGGSVAIREEAAGYAN